MRNTLISVIFGAAFVSELWRFLEVSWFFLHFPPISDSAYYTAMARGLLNGLQMYTDLFESKPPIIFWLVELSLKTGIPTLYIWLQLILLLSLSPVMAAFVYRATGVRLAVACAALLGITVAFDTVTRAMAYQPEGFAAVVSVYAILLFANGSRGQLLTVLSGIALGTVAMIKEPFILSVLFGMLVFCRSGNDLLRVAVIFCIGGTMSLLILACSGLIESYFSIYLPEMLFGRGSDSILYPDFGNRVYYLILAPLWVRSLTVYQMFLSMARASIFVPVFFLTCTGFFAPLSTEFTKRSLLFSFSLLLVALFSAYQGFILYELTNAIHLSGSVIPWNHPLISHLIALTTGPLIGFALFWTFIRRPPTRAQILSALAVLGLFCVTALVEIGGHGYAQYLALAIPPFSALALFCLMSNRTAVLAVLSTMLILNAFAPGKDAEQIKVSTTKATATPDWIAQAEKLDSVMDACGIDRYFLSFSDRTMIVAFTKHSPYQIYYGQKRALGGIMNTAANTTPNVYFAQKYIHDIQEAKIVVALPNDDPNIEQAPVYTGKILPMDFPSTPASNLPTQLLPVLRNEFTTSPPPCAAGLVPIEGIKVFFRNA